MVLQEPSFNDYQPTTILVPHNRPKSTKGKTWEIGQKLQMWDKMMSLKDRFKKETPQNLRPKFVEDMVVDVLKSNKLTEMFQAMVIIRLKMGNLGLKVQSLKNQINHN